ncbi:MAG: DUF4347 domain-containing protein [Oscillatoriales cyanobacterium]|nr:MAG: DUF4347 domain-containing protein [Oscillatoriales cyanobacterium]
MPNFINSVMSSIAFLDSALPDIQNLCNGIAAGIEVIIINAARDGVAQITEVLGSRSNIKSIHIISHGRSASLQWSRSLAESAEILLYGCDVAADDAGVSFVQQISRLTKAKIAASRGPIGNSALGGDWELDYTTGWVESELAIESATMAAYQFVFGLQLLGQAGFPANTTFGTRALPTREATLTTLSPTAAIFLVAVPAHLAFTPSLYLL